MSAISGYINTIQNAVYGEQVRTAIVNALLACYSDVENPDLQSAAFQTAIENAYEDGILDITTVTSFNDMTNQNIIYRYNGTAAGKQKGLYYYSALSSSWVLIGSEIQKVSLISQMTDVNDIYKYIGTESGMVQNSLYCHNGTSWVPIGSGVLTASTAAQMTNTDAIYKYTGSESGYVTNALYYYNGTVWALVSPKVETDKTLTQEDEPADAETVGNLFQIAEKDITVNFPYDGYIVVSIPWGTNALGASYAVSGWSSSELVPCGGCSAVTLLLTSLTDTQGLCFYDKNKTAISGYADRDNQGTQENTVPVPAGAEYFRVCIKNSDLPDFYAKLETTALTEISEVSNEFDDVKGKTDAIAEALTGESFIYADSISVDFWIKGGLIADKTNSNYGGIMHGQADSLWKVSGFVNCENYEHIVVTMDQLTTQSIFGLVFYDSNDSPVDSVVCPLGEQKLVPVEIEVPSDAKTFRVAARNESIASFYAKVAIPFIDVNDLTGGGAFGSELIAPLAGYESEITVNVSDFDNTNLTDSEIIQQAIDFTSPFAKRTLVFDRDFLIDESIILPSNTTVIIDGHTIKQADETFDTVFRGDNLTFSNEHPYGYATSYTEIENIKILGKNGAVISGPDVNATIDGDTAVGDGYGWRTLTINFAFAKNVEIGGFALEKTRCWAISFEKSSYVNVYDIDITSTVINGDCVDFRAGCHHCTVSNITGSTSDDTVACTAFKYGNTYPNTDANYPHSYYKYPLEPSQVFNDDLPSADLDIHDIRIQNIKTGGRAHACICFATDGVKVYNILFDDIADTGNHIGRTAVVELYSGSYTSGAYIAGDIHDIRLNNIVATGSQYVFKTGGVVVENVWANKLQRDGSGGIGMTSFYDSTGITVTNSGS